MEQKYVVLRTFVPVRYLFTASYKVENLAHVPLQNNSDSVFSQKYVEFIEPAPGKMLEVRAIAIARDPLM